MSETDITGLRIFELQAEIERLRAALKPFADMAEHVAANHPGWDHDKFSWLLWSGENDRMSLFMSDIRRAKAALEQGGDK